MNIIIKEDRGIVRFYWGEYSRKNRVLKRKGRVDGNIKYILRKNKYKEDFVTYVWGKENYKFLKNYGLKNIRLVCDEPFQFDLTDEQYRHKAEGLKIAMGDYKEIIHLDWDCFLKKLFSGDIWQKLSEKESFQANLYQYKRVRCAWRREDRRKIPNGGFLYIRDKNIPDEIIKVWESKSNTDKRSLEPAMMLWMDLKYSGWIGLDNYFKLHEPNEVCSLRWNSPYDFNPDTYYEHQAGGQKII